MDRYLFLLFLFLYVALSECGPSLPAARRRPGPVVEGSTVRLECQLSSHVSGPAIWLKLDSENPHNHEVIAHGDMVISENKRYSALFDNQINTYSLQISNFTYDDQGAFQCQVPVSEDGEEVQATAPVMVKIDGISSDAAQTIVSILSIFFCASILVLITFS